MDGAHEGSTGSAWHGDDYEVHASHHRSVDEWFLARHRPRDGDVVVDVGCGAGEFTARLADLTPAGRVIGVEPDPSMLATAQAKAAPNLELRAGRFQDLDVVCEPGSADLVLSRAVMHWIPIEDHPRCYEAALRVLRPGGWFHSEAGSHGNVARVRDLLDEVAATQGIAPASVSFPHPGQVMELVERAGFELDDDSVTAVAQRRRFDREGLLGFLRTQATTAYVPDASASARRELLAAAEERLDELRHHDGSFDQTFVRVLVHCRRPA